MNYADDMTVWNFRTGVIQDFALVHPIGHSIHRMGDYLECRTCSITEYAPPAGKRPLTPMEASLSRFD